MADALGRRSACYLPNGLLALMQLQNAAPLIVATLATAAMYPAAEL